jgi:hypothetical protein
MSRYVNTSKRIGDPDHIKVFANPVGAETWLEEMTPKVWHSNSIGRRTILAILLILVLAPIWNVLGR